MPLKLSAALTLLLFAALAFVGAPLTTDAAPLGIVSFELARTPAAADAMLDSWDATARLRAAFSLGLDYLFMLAYGTFFALASLNVGHALRVRRLRLAAAARPLAWGAGLAGMFDMIENLALAVILFSGQAVFPWPFAAWLCALIKFTLLGIVSVYLILSVATLISCNFSRSSSYNG